MGLTKDKDFQKADLRTKGDLLEEAISRLREFFDEQERESSSGSIAFHGRYGKPLRYKTDITRDL